MRDRCIDLAQQRVLISSVGRSTQSADLSVPANCGGLGRIKHFRSSAKGAWPKNCLPGLPASKWLQRPMREETRAQVFQLAGCPLRCWYCYVPFQLLSGNQNVGAWKSANDLLDLYLDEEERPDIIDLSGGAPELVPEWVAWMATEIEARGLSRQVFLWSDDSLTTDLLVRSEMRPLLRKIEGYRGYSKVCCLKGVSTDSFEFTTGASGEGFRRQIDILKRYLVTDIDLYAYITLAFPPQGGIKDAIDALLDELQGVDEAFIGRIVPLRVEQFSNMATRTTDMRSEALRFQDDVIQIWNECLSNRGAIPMPTGATANE